jgi:cytochrome c oxidase subunit 1
MHESQYSVIWPWLASLFAIAILSFLVWAHHMFVSGLNPFLGSIFVLVTLLIAVPSAIKVFNWLTTLWRGNIRFTPAMLFAIGFVSLFISGGLTGIWLGNSALDIHLHDTYFIIAHFHIVMGVASMFGMFAGIYHWYPKMFGRYLNNTLGYIHFWITIIGAILFSGLCTMKALQVCRADIMIIPPGLALTSLEILTVL